MALIVLPPPFDSACRERIHELQQEVEAATRERERLSAEYKLACQEQEELTRKLEALKGYFLTAEEQYATVRHRILSGN